MSSPSAIVCREIFDENSQPSAEEISEYAQQLGIDPESETHLLPLAREGLMQALPYPWKAYYDEKLNTHYYYNEETKNTQWEHPLDNIYRDLVKRARDASTIDDTCASVQELLTSEEYTKNLERVETKVESDDDDLSTDSENQATDVKDNSTTLAPKRLTPLGRPPLPITRLDKKLSDFRISPLRRSVDSPISGKHNLVRNISDRDLLNRPTFERPKVLFKQQSEIIDLKMHVEEEKFGSLFTTGRQEKGLPMSGKGSMFFKVSKSDLPSPETDKSLPLDSVTKSDPPKSILREKICNTFHRKTESVLINRPRQTSSFDEDRKSVRFKLENVPEPTISPGSNSSSEQNDGQSSIVSAAPSPKIQPIPGSIGPPKIPPLGSIVLAPLVSRPPLPPKPLESPREKSVSDKESAESDGHISASPRRRVLRPPAADYIKPDLFQKNFQKISDLVRPGDIETKPVLLAEPQTSDKDRPRSPMIPQKSKISINLMESIESETSIDSPDKEFANMDLNDLDDSSQKDKPICEGKENDLAKDETNSDKSTPKQNMPNNQIPQIKVPSLELFNKSINSDSEISSKIDEISSKSPEVKNPQLKISPTLLELSSPRLENAKLWSPLSTFKPLNRGAVSPQVKSSDSNTSLGKNLTPRLDGVILSQGKTTDNVVVMYQFDDGSPKPRSPLIPDMGFIERNKGDERRRLELSLQKELENMRVEWSVKERKMRAELQEELKGAEEKFLNEKRVRLNEQTERHKREMEEILSTAENNHHEAVNNATREIEERAKTVVESAEKEHSENMAKLHEEYHVKLNEQKHRLEAENERALSELYDQLQGTLSRERSRMIEENRMTIERLRDEHNARVTDLRHDYRVEVERLRSQHACHLEELRARLSSERMAAARCHVDRTLADKYKCLKEKYARLKHDVKMSIERRNKRREMSMTTGSETEKSNSHKATQSLERCRELNETSVSAVIEPAAPTSRNNNAKYNDNETSHSESNAHRLLNNNQEFRTRDVMRQSVASQVEVKPRPRRSAVAFREPPRKSRHKHTDGGAATDCQDSSDATTADEKPKETINGHGRRRCFTRLKSASTSRLNYSPKRGEGWSSPLESLRQQLRKLDDLEDQFPDLACQPAYSLRYPFAELGPVSSADTPELEFVRHRAVVEREGMRRARDVLKRRRAALRETSLHTPSEDRESTELEVALHRARALLGEKEIRLRHIERALKKLSEPHPPSLTQEGTTSEASSGSSRERADSVVGGAVLRSLRALHADVRDIWRALDVRRAHTASPETSSCNAVTTSHTRLTLSAPEPRSIIQEPTDGSVSGRAKGLRAWLQTAP